MVRDGEGEGARRAERGEEEEDGGADPSLRPLPSRVLLANQRQHSEGSLSLSLRCLLFSPSLTIKPRPSPLRSIS